MYPKLSLPSKLARKKPTFEIPEKEIFKLNRTFCNFYPTLPKTFFKLKMNKWAPFNYPKWKLSSQIDSGAFVKIITQKLIK